MDTKQAYNTWSQQYDTNENKTRDLEGIALRNCLADFHFENVLEIGCGTGKNTEWLITKAKRILAIDLSDEMLNIARKKIQSPTVLFQLADINQNWTFVKEQFDLISFSLVLEHIEYLEPIFKELSCASKSGGYVYIGELHPFKQYTGSKARFETEKGQQIVSCFNHHLSDFTQLAKKYGFDIADFNEYFDDNNKTTIPRIFTLLLKKN